MKGIVNILIVILITYTLNAIPVNTTLLSFDLIKPWDKLSAENSDEPDSTEVPAPHISFNANKDTHLSNPSSLTLELTSDSALTDEQLKDLTDTLNITVSDTQNTRTLTPATVIKDAPTLIGDNLYALTFDVSKDTLECGMGQYEFSVAIGSELLHADAAAKTLLSYMPPIHYTPAIAEVDSNQIYTQVYYLNATKAFLVPVTKKLDASSKFIRNTISTLSYEAPNNEQLFAQNVVFPRLPKVYLHNSTLSCYLDGDDVSKFTSGSSENKLVSEAILRTLTSISYVDHMVFYVNDRQNGNFINGLPLKTVYNEDFNAYAYVNYMDSEGNSYLVPYAVDSSGEAVESLLNTLQTLSEKVGESGYLTATVPSSVTLQEHSMDKDILTLVFSDDLITAYADDHTLASMMMDSIVETFTSLPSVESVIIKTATQGTDIIGNTPLGIPVTANKFLNPIE